MKTAMRSRKKTARKSAKKHSKGKKLVGYWEDREKADAIHAALKERGTDTSEFLRSAYRSVLNENGNAAAELEWTMKEAAIARRLGISKTTLKGMRDHGELKDEHGPIWRRPTPSSTSVLYDVMRTREFFGLVNAAKSQTASAE